MVQALSDLRTKQAYRGYIFNIQLDIRMYSPIHQLAFAFSSEYNNKTGILLLLGMYRPDFFPQMLSMFILVFIL